MSLVEPFKFTEFWAKYKRPLMIVGLGLLLLLIALFLYDCGGDYFFNRDIDKTKANVNAALTEANTVSANINAEKQTEKQIIANVEKAVAEHLGSVNATDAQRANVNAAVEKMKQAANQNKNVNSAELEAILNRL